MRPPLHCMIQNDRTSGLLRANPGALAPPTVINQALFVTHVFRDVFVRPWDFWPVRSAGQVDAMKQQAAEVVNWIQRELRTAPQPLDQPLLVYLDLEESLLDYTRTPYYDDQYGLTDQQLMLWLCRLVRDRLSKELGIRAVVEGYRQVRNLGYIWGRETMQVPDGDDAHTTTWGAPALALLLRHSTFPWIHCYFGEHGLPSRGADARQWVRKNISWQAQQYAAAGAMINGLMIVDWIYDQPTYDSCMAFFEGAKDFLDLTNIPAALALAGDWKAGADDSYQTPAAQHVDLVNCWNDPVVRAYTAVFG